MSRRSVSKCRPQGRRPVASDLQERETRYKVAWGGKGGRGYLLGAPLD
jgi:hypothetical protein